MSISVQASNKGGGLFTTLVDEGYQKAAVEKAIARSKQKFKGDSPPPREELEKAVRQWLEKNAPK
jgi:hypothetical protein